MSGVVQYTGLVFNKTYHAQARSGGMVSAGQVLEELVDRAAERRRRKCSGNLQGGVQLELFAEEPVPMNNRSPFD